jgi:hypothetical protein
MLMRMPMLIRRPCPTTRMRVSIFLPVGIVPSSGGGGEGLCLEERVGEAVLELAVWLGHFGVGVLG